jgi:hypothetical protein
VQRLERLVAAGPDVVGAVVEPLHFFWGVCICSSES